MNPIKELRRALGCTQLELAAEVGMNPSSIGKWELGQRPEHRSLDLLIDLALRKNLTGLAGELRAWGTNTSIPSEMPESPATGIGAPTIYAGNRQRYHAMLDAVVDRGEPGAIACIAQMLEFTSQSAPQARSKPRKKPIKVK